MSWKKQILVFFWKYLVVIFQVYSIILEYFGSRIESWLNSATQRSLSHPTTRLDGYSLFYNLFFRTISINLNGFCGISGGLWYFQVQSHSFVNFRKINSIKAYLPKLDLNITKWVWSNFLWISLFWNKSSLSLAEVEARIIFQYKSFCSFTHGKYNFNWLNFFNLSLWTKKIIYFSKIDQISIWLQKSVKLWNQLLSN